MWAIFLYFDTVHRWAKFHYVRMHGVFYYVECGTLPEVVFKYTFFSDFLEPSLRSICRMCVTMQNFVKIGQAVVKISHLTFFFKMATVRHVEFFKIWIFEQPIWSGVSVCTTMQNFVKISPTVLKISRFFDFQDGDRQPSWIFRNLCFWTATEVWRKFHQNRSNDCWNIAMYDFFQDGGRLPAWICEAHFGSTDRVFGDVYHYAKLDWNC